MSQLTGGHLELANSFNFNRQKLNNYKRNSIDTNNFLLWIQRDMYRSSYAHHHSPESVYPRASFIPGYAGYVPTDRAESLHAKTFTNKSKDILSNGNIGVNKTGLATTGFNLNKSALIDNSKNASSHKYGKTQIQTPHPGWIPSQWKSTTKSTYLNPNQLAHPCYRSTDKNTQANKSINKTSGFQQNRDYWDGKGWKPDPILMPKNIGSEYRDRFNPERDFHRNTVVNILPQLKKPEYKYSFNL